MGVNRKHLFPEKVVAPLPKDCSEIQAGSCSGVYTILPKNGPKIAVFCEMNTISGGWTVSETYLLKHNKS